MRPLEGLKVLDFCWVAVGPMTTSYLAEYGATVVRVESKLRPEVLRSAPPFGGSVRGPNRSAYYANYNANKFGFGLNMAHPQGVEVVKRLVAWADLVTENFTPGTLEKWGLGYDDLCAVKPDVILFSTSMLGRGGPHSRQPGFGPVLSSLSGMTGLTGWPDRPPTNPYGAYTDFIVPRFAIPTILAALDYRRRTGRGQHIDISQLEASLHFLAPPVVEWAMMGREPERCGNRHPSAAPHGAYPCQGDDRWCTIACLSEAHWQALCGAMEHPAWSQEARFATQLARKAHEDAAGWSDCRMDPSLGRPRPDAHPASGWGAGGRRADQPRRHRRPATGPPRPLRLPRSPRSRPPPRATLRVPPFRRCPRAPHARPAPRPTHRPGVPRHPRHVRH